LGRQRRWLTNLVLDKELDTLDGGSSSLRDGSGNTTHQEVDDESGHAEDGLLGLVNVTLGHVDGCEGRKLRKRRREEMGLSVKKEQDTSKRMGGEKRGRGTGRGREERKIASEGLL
jgi:hypothetical protein